MYLYLTFLMLYAIYYVFRSGDALLRDRLCFTSEYLTLCCAFFVCFWSLKPCDKPINTELISDNNHFCLPFHVGGQIKNFPQN